MSSDPVAILSAAPNVDIYGDDGSWPMIELVHSEMLADRSQIYDWRIRPHQHSNLVQLFLVVEGRGRTVLDSVTHGIVAPTLMMIPARCVHEFEWDCASQGYVLSIAAPLVGKLLRKAGIPGSAVKTPLVVNADAEAEFLQALFGQVHAEFINERAYRDQSLESLVQSLLISVRRHTADTATAEDTAERSYQHFERFAQLVEAKHKLQWPVTRYADSLGMTGSHLNSICRKVAGKSALDVIHDRLLLAARRSLVYTEKTVAGVSHSLGFEDPSYFSRFFKRRTGVTPRQFRRQSGTSAKPID